MRAHRGTTLTVSSPPEAPLLVPPPWGAGILTHEFGDGETHSQATSGCFQSILSALPGGRETRVEFQQGNSCFVDGDEGSGHWGGGRARHCPSPFPAKAQRRPCGVMPGARVPPQRLPGGTGLGLLKP